MSLSLDKIIKECNTNVETSYNCDAITGKDILDGVRGLTFDGVSGYISIVNSNPTFPSMSYVQYVGAPLENLVGVFQNGTCTINYSALFFRGGSAVVPISAIVPESISFDDFGGIFFSSLAAFLIFVCFILIGLIVYHKQKPSIKRSSPLFCILILVGVIFVLSSLISGTAYLSSLSCNLTLWFLFIGIALILSSLLAKTYRIFKIFSTTRHPARVIHDKELLLFSGVLLLFFSVLLLIISHSNSEKPYVYYSTTDPLVSFISCTSTSNVVAQVAYFILLGSVVLLLLLLSIFAYLIRNVDSAFNESMHIGITVFSYLALLIVIIPLFCVTGEYKMASVSKYYELSTGLCLAMISTICVLFLPKFYIIYKNTHPGIYATEQQPLRFADMNETVVSLDPSITDINSESHSEDCEPYVIHESEDVFLTKSMWAND